MQSSSLAKKFSLATQINNRTYNNLSMREMEAKNERGSQEDFTYVTFQIEKHAAILFFFFFIRSFGPMGRGKGRFEKHALFVAQDE
jgi:hypothetical protein